MKSVSKPESSSVGTERELFWQHHIDQQSTNNLSGLAYCRLRNLNYPSFTYWARKLRASKNDKTLVAIKLKSNQIIASSPTLCTLHLKDGRTLQIHDINVLSMILQ